MAFRGTVLVVDDEEGVRTILRRALSIAGYQVLEGSNGAVALDVLRTHSVDVLLTDWKMPEVDGLQLLRRCRLMYHELDVILMTGYGTIENAVDTLKSGAFDYVTKPLVLKEVIGKVDECLAARRARPGRQSSGSHNLIAELADVLAVPASGVEFQTLVVDLVWKLMSPSFTAVFVSSETGRPTVTSTRGRLGSLQMDWMPRTLDDIRAMADAQSSWRLDSPDPEGEVFEDPATSAVSVPMMVGNLPVGLLRMERQDSTHPFCAYEAQMLYVGGLMVAEAAFRELPSTSLEKAQRAAQALLDLCDLMDRGRQQAAQKVASLARQLALDLGLLEEDASWVELAALLADVGMVISAEPLPSASRPAHVLDGARIMGAFPSLQRLADPVLYHHEAWDGSGYPDGLCEQAIPLESRIIAVALALCSEGKSWGHMSPLANLRAESGHHFDPTVVDAYMHLSMIEKVPERSL